MSGGDDSPSHRMTSSTSKGYFISPSTNPGESTNVTRLNLFCLDVQISVLKYSETPGSSSKTRNWRVNANPPNTTEWARKGFPSRGRMFIPLNSCKGLKCGYRWRVAFPWRKEKHNAKENPHFIVFSGNHTLIVTCYFFKAWLTVRDSRLRPLVTKLKPWVSMATPVRWICSSTYLTERRS